MKSRALDSDKDWSFGAGLSSYVYNNNAIAQNIETRLRSYLGNCFFDLGAGLDWPNLLGSIGQQAQLALNLNISTTLLNTVGVTALKQLTSTFVDRQFLVSYSVQTVFSTVSSTFVFDSTVS